MDSRGVEDEMLLRRSHSDTITSSSTSGVCDTVAAGSKQSRIISIDSNVDKTTSHTTNPNKTASDNSDQTDLATQCTAGARNRDRSNGSREEDQPSKKKTEISGE